MRRIRELRVTPVLLLLCLATASGPPGSVRAEPVRAVAVRSGPVAVLTSSFDWPLGGRPRPVRQFDPPTRPWLAGHRGVDLATVSGASVRAAGAGTVYFAGWVAGRPVVSVSHAAGLRTTYEPVRPVVRTGDRLAAGDRLGVLLPGHPGCPVTHPGGFNLTGGSGPAGGSGSVRGSGAVDPTGGLACLHWGLRRGADYLDPLALLARGRVRLFPTGSSRPAAHIRSGTEGEESRQPSGEAVVLVGAVVDLRR